MDKVYVVYWSQSGNTQAMAEAIGKGVTDAGKEAAVVFASETSLDELKSAKAFALGCPAMGAEVLEESEMEPFVCAVEGFDDYVDHDYADKFNKMTYNNITNTCKTTTQSMVKEESLWQNRF